MFMKILFLFLIYFVNYQIGFSQEVKISVFNNLPLKGFSITANKGKYSIYQKDEKITDISGNEALYITLFQDKLVLQNAKGLLGSFQQIRIISSGNINDIRITPVEPKANGKIFPGNILLRIDYGRILIINEVDIERYIAGVVEAETGSKAEPEFQKAQALLCRTYLYSHINRHETEGFNLCDEVHCQAYRGVSAYTDAIYKSTSLTRNLVVVAFDSSFITASFHGNCGGETESSGNTWLNGKSYLQPVKDPYCQQKPNANWQKEIPLMEWKTYLKNNGFKLKSKEPASFETTKLGRQQYYRVGADSTLTKQIRADWKLKSSYFQISANDKTIKINGHGFGHGVGMCQDGAMKMATMGFRCEDIIGFYYTGVKVISINELSGVRPKK